MNKPINLVSHFAVISDIRAVGARCHIVFDNFADSFTAGQIADLISGSLLLSCLGYVHRPYFIVDKRTFTDCIIFDVSLKTSTRLLDNTTVEAITAAEFLSVCEKLEADA